MEAKAKAKSNTKKQLSDEKTKLIREIRSRKAELDLLNAKISDLEKLSDKRDFLQNEVDELTQKKLELGKLTVQQQSVTKEVKELNAEKKKLSSYIKNNKPKMKSLESELDQLEHKKVNIEGKLDSLLQNQKNTNEKVGQLKDEKAKYETEISGLKTEYGLLPRDIKEMSKDSINQLKKYSFLAMLSVTGTLIMMGLLIFFLIQPVVDNAFADSFSDPNLAFYSILSTKILLFSGLVIFVLVLLSLTRGFLSQYIKSRNRLTSLRVTDYFVDRVQSTSNGKADVELLKDFLPKIMDHDGSFDRSK